MTKDAPRWIMNKETKFNTVWETGEHKIGFSFAIIPKSLLAQVQKEAVESAKERLKPIIKEEMLKFQNTLPHDAMLAFAIGFYAGVSLKEKESSAREKKR